MKPYLIVGLQVYNEAQRFLPEWVAEVRQYADELVALDDCSEDATVSVLFQGFQGKPLNVSRASENLFTKNELLLRKWLWNLLKTRAQSAQERGFTPWILLLDADEFLEEKFKRDCRALLCDASVWYYGLKFHHFWRSRTHYRTDKMWAPSWGPRLVRYDSSLAEEWRETPLHCGSTPKNIFGRPGHPGKNIDYIIKHYGYVLSPEEKHKRYSSLDPDGKYAAKSHYDSILDQNVTLVEWKERV